MVYIVPQSSKPTITPADYSKLSDAAATSIKMQSIRHKVSFME